MRELEGFESIMWHREATEPTDSNRRTSHFPVRVASTGQSHQPYWYCFSKQWANSWTCVVQWMAHSASGKLAKFARTCIKVPMRYVHSSQSLRSMGKVHWEAMVLAFSYNPSLTDGGLLFLNLI